MRTSFKTDIKENLAVISLISFLQIIKTAMVFALPIVTARITKGMLTRNNIIILFATVIAAFAVEIIVANLQKRTEVGYKCCLNEKIYNQMYRISYESLIEKGMIYYLEKINLAVANYSNYVMATIPSFVSVLGTLIVSIVLIGIFDLKIALAIVLIFALQTLSLRLLNNHLSKKCVNLQSVCAESFSNILSVLNCVDYFKQLSSHQGINRLLSKDVRRIHKHNTEVNVYARNISSIIFLMITNLQFLLYIVCGYMMISSQITGSQFIYIIMLINICFSAFSNFSSIEINKKDYNASREFLKNEIEDAQEESGDVQVGSIDKVLIKNIDLNLKRGDVVFLSGETGTGKSSLLKVLLGFYRIDGVKVNGSELKKLSLASLREKVAYVSQDNSIVSGSVYDNIFMGESAEEMDRIKNLAFLSKFVSGQDFSDEMIMANGTNLSGGDKQKLAVARLFAGHPDVLILDEITSSMDNATTDLVFGEILDAFADKIIIIVSHNDYIKKYANRFLDLHDSSIEEAEVHAS
ncbi:MAG: ABC transporter ATP-binding protein [Eubacteriales bacterium]|nr:ABC transporter ATP-binding protein [Eubacteriales bacterium]